MIRAILYITDDSKSTGKAKLSEIEGESLVDTLTATAKAIDDAGIEGELAQITVKVESPKDSSDVDLKAAVKKARGK